MGKAITMLAAMVACLAGCSTKGAYQGIYEGLNAGKQMETAPSERIGKPEPPNYQQYDDMRNNRSY